MRSPALSLLTTPTRNLLGLICLHTVHCPSMLQLSPLEDPSDPSAFRPHSQSTVNFLNNILPLLALYCILPPYWATVPLAHHGQGQLPSFSSCPLPDDPRGSAHFKFPVLSGTQSLQWVEHNSFLYCAGI